MQKHELLISRALRDGFKISVYDGGEWAVHKSRDIKEILGAVHSVDDSELQMYRGEERIWVYIVLQYGEEDTVNDYTPCPYMDELEEEDLI